MYKFNTLRRFTFWYEKLISEEKRPKKLSTRGSREEGFCGTFVLAIIQKITEVFYPPPLLLTRFTGKPPGPAFFISP
ncbi:hypothetical protein NPIL_478801, partial [Nephila pilipes]